MFNPKSMARTFFTDMKEVPSTGITLRKEVRDLCKQNTCGYYGKNWTCPPAVPPLSTFKERFGLFDTFLVVYQVYPTQGSFDWKGMMAGAVLFKKNLQDMKTALEAVSQTNQFLILGMGPCDLCEPCSYVDGEPCRNPEEAIISLEACGIDVMRLMKEHGLNYYNGKNTVTLVGGILYNKGSCSS